MLSTLAIALCSASANAHEFWVEPSTFVPEADDPIGIRLCVGDGFEGWSLPRDARRIEHFVAAGPGGEQPIVGLDGADPAGVVRLTAPGGYVIAYRSNPAFQVLPADRFEEHLRDKGLERIVALRRERGASDRKAREAYSRHAKALIRVGGALTAASTARSVCGSSSSPSRTCFSFAPTTSGASAFCIAAARSRARSWLRARPETADDDLKARTDADGRASFRMREPGMWRVAAVHMIEARGNVAADWESLWASLTFELPSQGSHPRPAEQRAPPRVQQSCGVTPIVDTPMTALTGPWFRRWLRGWGLLAACLAHPAGYAALAHSTGASYLRIASAAATARWSPSGTWPPPICSFRSSSTRTAMECSRRRRSVRDIARSRSLRRSGSCPPWRASTARLTLGRLADEPARHRDVPGVGSSLRGARTTVSSRCRRACSSAARTTLPCSTYRRLRDASPPSCPATTRTGPSHPRARISTQRCAFCAQGSGTC